MPTRMRAPQLAALFTLGSKPSSLVTLLVLILSTVVHFISILVDESDDENPNTGLGLDSQDFSVTPVVSPNDNLVGLDEQHQPEPLNDDSHLSPLHATEQQQQQYECDCPLKGLAERGIDVPTLSLMSPMLMTDSAPLKPISEPDIISARPEDIQSAELNSALLKDSENQRREEAGPQVSYTGSLDSGASLTSNKPTQADTTTTTADSTLDSWAQKTPDIQKGMISSQLGQPASKQIFDDFDHKEMQLGGTALHWCKTRKSLDKLIKLGLPTDIVNKRRETALHVAVRRHKLPVIIGLLIHEANTECRNENGETPLIVACKLNDIFAAQLLMIFDANYDATDRWSCSARHYTSAICARHRGQQQLPSAAHLILAMLNEIGAKRCCAPSSPSDPGSVSSDDERNKSSDSLRQTSDTDKGVAEGSPAAASASNQIQQQSSNSSSSGSKRSAACTDGCAHSGAYNGNSYNRWPNLKRESLYKRHMFSDMIQKRLRDRAIEKAAADRRSQRKQNTNRGYACAYDDEQEAARNARPKRSRLLCIDGGGLRGIVVCQIMIEMEKLLARPMISYFDWVGGTSVGAFLACALSRGTSLKELRRVCFDVKDEIFSGGRPYNSKFLERVFKRTLGSATRMSDVKGVKLAVTTVLADREPCQLRLFRNYDSPARLLEAHGYAPDTFNNMSGHSIVRSNSSKSASTTGASVESAAPADDGSGARPLRIRPRKNSSARELSHQQAESVASERTCSTPACFFCAPQGRNPTTTTSHTVRRRSHSSVLAPSQQIDTDSATTTRDHLASAVLAGHDSQAAHASRACSERGAQSHRQNCDSIKHEDLQCQQTTTTTTPPLRRLARRALAAMESSGAVDTANQQQQQQPQQACVSRGATKCTCSADSICGSQVTACARAKSAIGSSAQSTKLTSDSCGGSRSSEPRLPQAMPASDSNSGNGGGAHRPADRDHGESMLDENDPDPIIWQAVRASSAAPFYFRPYGPFLDGGIISNNPTLDMLSEFENYQKVRRFLRAHARQSARPLSDMQLSVELNSEPPSELDLVVSLGAGRGRVISRQTMIDFGQVASGFATVFSPVELVRSIRAARDLFKKLMQQSCHTDDHILDRAQAWCSSLDIPYFRINPPLSTIFSIDDKRDEQLINALWQTKLYMASMRDQLEELAKLLDDD